MSGSNQKKSGVQRKTRNTLIIGDKKFNVIPGTKDSYSIIDKIEKKPTEPKMAKGGRVGLKAGSKGCKLAMKGKGRAYGKNS
jgi:hypothetical protein